MKDWAKKVVEGCYLLIDIESTGGAFYDEMIEIAIADVAGRKIIYNSLIKPTTNINKFAEEVHGITYKTLENAPYLDSQVDKLNTLLANRSVISYNVAFDKRLFIQSYDKYGLELPNISWECMMLQASEFFSKKYSLANLCRQYGIEPGTHRAKSDVIAATKLIYKFMELDVG
jgi:DNA polymerase-3 subunit epsilon